MGERPYCDKYSTRKKRAKNLKFPSSCPYNVVSFIPQMEGRANSAIQRYLKSRICREPSTSCVHIPRPGFPPCPDWGSPVWRGRGQRAARAAPAFSIALCAAADSGAPTETHPSSGETRGGKLATGCREKANADLCPGCWKTWLAGYFIWSDFGNIKKKKNKKERKGGGEREAHRLAQAYGWSYLHIEILLRFAHCST